MSAIISQASGLDRQYFSSGPSRALFLFYGVLAASLGGCLVWFGPPGVDLAAHLYQRALFVEHGFSFWNNFWYAGRYSYVTYSLLYYPLAALIGIKTLAVASVAIGAAAFGVVVEREWGSCARRAACLFAVALAASLLLAAFPYTLGLAFALMSIVAAQVRRFKAFAALVVATFAASPLAFFMLVVVLIAAFARSRRFAWQAGLPVLGTAGFGALLWRLFPGNGWFPFSLTDLAAVLLFCALGLILTRRVERAGLLFALFGTCAATSVLCFLVPSGIGANVGRLRYVAVPLAMLTLSLRRWKPLVPTLAVFGLALAWNVTPLIASLERSADDPSASRAYWLPAIRFLHEHGGCPVRRGTSRRRSRCDGQAVTSVAASWVG